MATIEIGTWSSRCGSCHGDALPSETGHYSKVGYGPHGPGCGEEWTAVYLTTLWASDEVMRENIETNYPNLNGLPFVGYPFDDTVKSKEN